MKKFCATALILVLTLCLFAGCRSNPAPTTPSTAAPTTQPTAAPTTRPTTAPTTAPTTMPTTAPTTMPSTDMTGPDMDEMIPGAEDTIDPTNGANQESRNRARGGRY